MSTSTCPDENLKVKHVVILLEEVQSRYVNKLASINNKQISNEERSKQKIAIYESYIKDLSLQARLLLQSLDELEREANQRVALLENKLKKAQATPRQHQSLTDLSKTARNVEGEKRRITQENLDLKHDLDALMAFISAGKRTGKWHTKQLQLKTLSFDCLKGAADEKVHNAISMSKIPPSIGEEEKNLLLSKKVDDLRGKLADEYQKSESLKMEIHSKTAQLTALQEDLTQKKHQYEEHIHDLSTKLKTISERHRDSTTTITNDVKIKKEQIEQLNQQLEEAVQDRSDLRRQCCAKENTIVDLQAKIQSLDQQLHLLLSPREPTVSKTEHEILDHELQTTRKQLEAVMIEIKTTDALNGQLEQDLRLFKKFHDEQFEQQIKTTAVTTDQLHAEIRVLKQNCSEKDNELNKHSLELRSCQGRLTIVENKNTVSEQENQQLRNRLQITDEKLEKCTTDLKQSTIKNEQSEQAINDFTSRHHLLERKLIEAMHLVDLRNQTLINYEEQIHQLQNDQADKQKEILEKQSRIDQLEPSLASKTTELTELAEKYQQQEKLHHDQTNKASSDMKALQRELQHISASLAERDRAIATLTEQRQQLTQELRIKQEEVHQMEKSFNKQLTVKQDQLVRYDQNLHEAEIKCNYAQEECLIQEKELARLNWIQEEQENKIRILQEDLLKSQEQKEAITVQYERSETELQNLRQHREEESRKYKQEFDKINNELTALRIVEITLLRNIDELKENLSVVSIERNEIREKHKYDHHSIENIQQILSDEAESGSKAATKVLRLTQQLEDEQKRTNDTKYQLNELQMQLDTASLTIDTLKAELSQSRSAVQDQLNKETELKQNLSRLKSSLDERSRSLDDRQREIATLNQLMSHLQTDYEKCKSDLSITQDKVLHLEIENDTIKQRFLEKINELTAMDQHLQQSYHQFQTYEKTHRYSNEEYFEQEQHGKSIEQELVTVNENYEKLQRAHQDISEQLNQYRDELEESEKSETIHKEQLIRSMDGAKIYKQKLALLGECFKTIVRKASETSEQWVELTTRLDEQITDLSDEAEQFQSLAERFEQSVKLSTQLRMQHEDSLAEFSSLKSNVGKIHSYLRRHQQRCSQTRNENLHLRMETKRLRDKIESYHRAESVMHSKHDDQEIGLAQLRKELNHELQARSNAQRTIEQLKHTLNERTHERNQYMKNIDLAHKQIEKLQKEIDASTAENRRLQQTVNKFEEQTRVQSESFEHSTRSFQEKIHECESLLISLTETNQNSMHLLHERNLELDMTQSEMQSLKQEHTSTIEKFEETSQEFKRHITTLERSIEEHKRLVRKREKELEKMQTDFAQKPLNLSCTEIGVLQMENSKLSEELKLMRENTHLQSSHFLPDGLSDLCLHHANDPNSQEPSRTCVLQSVVDDGDNARQKETVWFPFGSDLSFGLSERLSSQKKYKLMKAYSKQQQFLLTQLEAQVQFYESVFTKHCVPAIQCSTGTETLESHRQCEEQL